MPRVGRLCFATSGLFLSRPPGVFSQATDAPHAAVAFGDADVGDAIRHLPVTGRIGGQGAMQCRSLKRLLKILRYA